MPRKATDLFARIASFPALHAAALKAVRGKRKKPGAAAFMARLEPELLRLERDLLDGNWRPGRYKEIRVREPKERLVSAAPFRDRVVHHALCAAIDPVFSPSFIAHSFANQNGKGTHRAIAAYERYRDRHRYVLRADIFRFFPAIDHEILKQDCRRRLACATTLQLIDRIIDGSNRQEAVELYFPGDDLFTPFERRRGLPIGNLTSQFFANLYLNGFDHFVTEVLHAPYVRYVDDFALFANTPEQLEDWRHRMARYLEGRRLRLHPRKTFVASTADPALFLGFELISPGYRRLPEENVRRFRNKLRGFRDRWRAGTIREQEVRQSVTAWVAHAGHARTWRLRQTLFGDGWFAPSVTGA